MVHVRDKDLHRAQHLLSMLTNYYVRKVYFVYHTIRKDIIKYVYLKILRDHVLKAQN